MYIINVSERGKQKEKEMDWNHIWRITGNTYANKWELKREGARWNPKEKAWEIRACGNGWEKTMYKLKAQGCRFTKVKVG